MNGTSSNIYTLIIHMGVFFMHGTSRGLSYRFPFTHLSIIIRDFSGFLENDALNVQSSQLGTRIIAQAVDEPPDRGDEQTSDQNDAIIVHGWNIDRQRVC